MSVFFRFDDIGRWNGTSLRFIELMESLERPYLLGVIPNALSWWMKNPLRATRHARIYQHGVDHKNRSTAEQQDELPAALGSDRIRQRLREGRRRLGDVLGREIPGYVPPWNRVSELALRVLEEEDYTCISARQELVTSLVQVHIQIDVYASYRPVTVRPIADIQREIQARGSSITGVMLHPLSTPRRHVPELEALIRQNSLEPLAEAVWQRKPTEDSNIE